MFYLWGKTYKLIVYILQFLCMKSIYDLYEVRPTSDMAIHINAWQYTVGKTLWQYVSPGITKLGV